MCSANKCYIFSTYCVQLGATALSLAIGYNILPVAYVLLEWNTDATLKHKVSVVMFPCARPFLLIFVNFHSQMVQYALNHAKDDAARSLLNIYLAGMF